MDTRMDEEVKRENMIGITTLVITAAVVQIQYA